MAKLELTKEELGELLDALDGSDVPTCITFKIAAARGSILDVFGGDPCQLLTLVSDELTEESTSNLMAFAVDLYQQEQTSCFR